MDIKLKIDRFFENPYDDKFPDEILEIASSLLKEAKEVIETLEDELAAAT